MDSEFTPQQLTQLLNGIIFSFSFSDLNMLCAGMGINYAELGDDNLGDRARELILYCQRRDMLPKLVRACREARPNYQKWPALDAGTVSREEPQRE